MNMLEEENYGIEKKQFLRYLTRYEQAHCKVTLTDDGLRIFRDPNLTQSADGNVMYGGMVVRQGGISTDNLLNLQKGHSYVITFNVRGKSSHKLDGIYWTNMAGWGGNGLSPTPSNVVLYSPVSANFNTDIWQTAYYKFTINDDIFKTCTKSYSSYVSGSTYLSYRDFFVYFMYGDTGEMGTDLYIKNLRMYDITGMDNMSVSKHGIKYIDMLENLNENDNAQIFKFGEVRGHSFYEI